jgi:hypothetical protein
MTAVEWLREKLQLEFGFVFSDNILEQAKEIEQEQMRAIFAMGMVNGINIDFEQFYNETFNKPIKNKG